MITDGRYFSFKVSHHDLLIECFSNLLCHHRHHCNQNCTSIRKADEEVDSDLVDSAEDTHRDKRCLTDCYNFEWVRRWLMVYMPRYMNYWLTTTTTVTQYSYTVTSKIASLQCTPRIGWEYQSCPDPGRWFLNAERSTAPTLVWEMHFKNSEKYSLQK